MNKDSEFLIGGDELFDVPRFVNHHDFMLKSYIPIKEKQYSFFLSCSKYKPYYKSPYRRLFYSMLSKNLDIRDKSQIYTVSEPAIIVPEELDDTNITAYDFPPENLTDKGKEIFILRLSNILPKLILAHEHSFYVLPRHHRAIFEQALERIYTNHMIPDLDKTLIISRVTYAPPLTYNLPKAKMIISETLNKTKDFY
ncbi:MAG: DUF5591 domain-containing protein [Candidatus Thorarchaeota archaeon]